MRSRARNTGDPEPKCACGNATRNSTASCEEGPGVSLYTRLSRGRDPSIFCVLTELKRCNIEPGFSYIAISKCLGWQSQMSVVYN